jgi:hypothetical protein
MGEFNAVTCIEQVNFQEDFMKKIFLAALLGLSMTIILFGQESNSSDNTAIVADSESGFSRDIRMGYSFPFIMGSFSNDLQEIPFGRLIMAFALSSISLGGGVQYTIIPHILAPGVYADLHFNVLSWFFVWAFTNGESNFMILQSGIRLYNQFKFSAISIEPFFGFNLGYISLDDIKAPIPLMAAGFVFNIGGFGIEYSYNLATAAIEDLDKFIIHRITFLWTLRPR